MSKVKAVLRGVSWIVVIAVAVQIASLAVKGVAMDNPPQYVQDERAIQRARLDVHYHNDTKEQMVQTSEYTGNDWCKQYGCED
ncbi:MAG: hypothetical protein Q4A74_00155 [Cardiobacteriaceae bacterium]|nr:hypothetical protein [Cardiobacteriaceae bacterium]